MSKSIQKTRDHIRISVNWNYCKDKKINLKDVVPFRVENHDALVEMVVLHGGGGVEDGQRWLHLRLERVVRPAVVQVVAKTRDQQTEYLKKMKD